VREDDRRIAALLEAAAPHVEFPETPPLPALVRRRIERGPIPVGTIAVPRLRPPLWRPVLAFASVVVLALAVTLALSATARKAVADLLGVVGIHVTFDDPREGLPPPRDVLELGTSMSTFEAAGRVGFEVLQPSLRRVAAVYFDASIGETGMVSFVYPPDAKSVSDVDLLVTQFAATLDGAFFKKVALAGGDVTYVDVRSRPGYWVGGGPHLFWYVDADGPRDETIRLAQRVLIWEEDGVTYRIEGAGSLRAALRIARGLR
jgi:hypothetical protein